MPGKAGSIRSGGAYVEIFGEDGPLRRTLANVRRRLDRFSASTARIGGNLARAATIGALPFAAATRMLINFDDAMRSVGAVTSASENQLQSMRDTAKQLGATTSFTASEVANLMVELGRAGFDPSQINEMTGAVLALSRATGTDATLSAGIMSATLRQFGLDAGQAARVADALATAANSSFNTVEGLGNALQYAGPIAADFGLELEDALAVLGTLGNVGIQGSNAGSTVRRLLTLTGAESEKLKGIFGVAFADAAGNARPLVDVLDEINQATAGLGTAARASKFNEAFGLLGITGASALGRAAGSTRELRAKLDEAAGSAESAAQKMDAGIGGAFRILMSSIEGVALSAGESIEPVVTKIAKASTTIAGSINRIISKNQSLVIGMAAGVAAAAAASAGLLSLAVAVKVAAFVVGALSIAMGALGAVITGIGAVVGAMLSPIGLVVAAVALLGITFEQQTGLISKSIASITDRFAALKTDAVAAFGGIKDAIAAGDLSAVWAIVVAGLQLTWSMSMDALRGGWALFTTFIEDRFEASMRYVLSLLKAVQNATSRKLIELNPTLTVEQKNEQLQTLDEDQKRAAAADLAGADRNRQAREQALKQALNESASTKAARQRLQSAIAAAAAARKAADSKTEQEKKDGKSSPNKTPGTGSPGTPPETSAAATDGNRDRTFFSANVARRQAAFVSQPAGPVAEQDRLRTKVDQTAESVKNSGREFKRWSQTAAVAAAAVSAAMNPSIVAADVPTVDDQTQAITQQIVAADVPSVDDQTQAITQQIVAADVPTASDQIASVQQRAYPADTRELIRAAKAANYQATVQQDVVAADMPTVDDQIATVQQRAYPADVRELIRAAKSGDYQATVQQDVIAADVPTVSDQTHAITQQLVTADIPTVSDQTQAITQQLVTADMPTVSDQTQAITQQIVAADMPTVSDQTQAVTQQLVAADVPSVDDQTQAITQQIVAADVPALPKLTQQITQQISQEIIDAAPVDSEPLSRRDAYLKRQGRDAPDNSEPLSRRAAYLAQRGRDVPAVKPTNDTVAQTPPLSRRAAYLKSKLFAPTKTAGLSDEQLARIDQFKTQRANIADSQTQRPTKPREDDGIGRAIAIARQQSELMKQGIGAVVATNQGALAEILKFAEANQKFTDRVNGSTRVPDSIDSDSTMIEVRRQIALQLPSIRAEITRPEAPGATPGSRQPDRQLPVLQQMALTLQRIERKPPGVGTFGS